MRTRRGLAGFCELHDKARDGRLSADEREDYSVLLQSFLNAMTDAQNAGLAPGQTPRRTARVRRAVQVDVTWPAAGVRSVTFDIGLGGFSVLLPSPPPGELRAQVSLRLPRGRQFSCAARVVSVRRRQRAAFVSFAFEEGAEGRAQLESYLVDELVAELVPETRRSDAAADEWFGEFTRRDRFLRATG